MPDYGRAALGLAACGAPLLLTEVARPLALLFALLLALFAWFALRTAWRQASAVELADDRLTLAGPFGARQLDLAALAACKLAYFAPRRRAGGWLQLTLRDRAGVRLTVDSGLEGFAQLLRRGVAAARRQGLELDPTTVANLAAAGLDPPPAVEAFSPSPSPAPPPR